MDINRFAKGTERLIDPITVGSAHTAQRYVGSLPLGLQRHVLEKASARTPYMGFVVEPYALLLFFRLQDEEHATSLLPKGFRLARTSVFAGDDEDAYAILSFFRVRTSTFWGSRAELYLVAQDEKTGLLTWVIVDYLSDTISYDRAHGLRGPSAPGSVMTSTVDGTVLAEFADGEGARDVAVCAKLGRANPRDLNARLWVEGNTSIAYGPHLSPDGPALFSLTFPRAEMASAWEIPPSDLRVERLEWEGTLISGQPESVVCFPHAQHLLSDSPGASSSYASTDALEQAVEHIDFDSIPRFMPSHTKKNDHAKKTPKKGNVMIKKLLALALVGAVVTMLMKKR